MDYLKLGIHKPIRLLRESVVTWLFDQAIDFPEWTSVERPKEGENSVLDRRKGTREETKLCYEVLEVMTGQNTGGKKRILEATQALGSREGQDQRQSPKI